MPPVLERVAHLTSDGERLVAGVALVGSPGLTGCGIGGGQAGLRAGRVRGFARVRLIAFRHSGRLIHHGVSSLARALTPERLHLRGGVARAGGDARRDHSVDAREVVRA